MERDPVKEWEANRKNLPHIEGYRVLHKNKWDAFILCWQEIREDHIWIDEWIEHVRCQPSMTVVTPLVGNTPKNYPYKHEISTKH